MLASSRSARSCGFLFVDRGGRMHIVLVEPEIPPNTGNIARTCAATGTTLHLIGPLGFSLDDRQLKRAGLDYWHLLDVHLHDNFGELRRHFPGGVFHLTTTRAVRRYDQVDYGPDDLLVFGRESTGLADTILDSFPDHLIRVPMRAGARSLNLANTVALVLYEALRQQGFPGLI